MFLNKYFSAVPFAVTRFPSLSYLLFQLKIAKFIDDFQLIRPHPLLSLRFIPLSAYNLDEILITMRVLNILQ